MTGHCYWISCVCKRCREETVLREEQGDPVLQWLRDKGLDVEATDPQGDHGYTKDCVCRMCLLETAGLEVLWEKAVASCAKHGGNGATACEICVDVACGADSEDAVMHVLGTACAATIMRNHCG
jgi:hypothetical protein